ncbi:hypothetical protein, partial [Helicobacter pylori]|uniref:hypothetical protein n=1 Tax=Helicobacter pylori TaxID=210 RepID=UPI000FDD5C68
SKTLKRIFHQTLPKNKTQRLKSESSGDWQKEKDQTPQKKEDLRERVQKKKDFTSNSPQK